MREEFILEDGGTIYLDFMGEVFKKEKSKQVLNEELKEEMKED